MWGDGAKADVWPCQHAWSDTPVQLSGHRWTNLPVREVTSLLLQAIAGYDPADPGSFEIPVGNYHAALLARTSTLRIGIPRNPFFSELGYGEIERVVFQMRFE